MTQAQSKGSRTQAAQESSSQISGFKQLNQENPMSKNINVQLLQTNDSYNSDQMFIEYSKRQANIEQDPSVAIIKLPQMEKSQAANSISTSLEFKKVNLHIQTFPKAQTSVEQNTNKQQPQKE